MYAIQAKPSPLGLRRVPISAPRRFLHKAGAAAGEFSGGKLENIKPSLPQYDLGGQDDRKVRLDNLRQKYILDPDFIPPFVLAKAVPAEDQFSTRYIVYRAASLIGVIIGDFPNVLKPFQPSLFGNEVARSIFGKKPDNKFAPLGSFEDSKKLFFHPGPPFFGIDVPEHADSFKNDALFAAERTSGPNPVVIRVLKADDARADVLKLVKPESLPTGFDLKAELAKGNVYVCDYTGTDPAYRAPAFMNGGGRYTLGVKSLPKPLAFFWWGQDQLQPLAIQLDCSKDPNSYVPTGARVYTPKEPKGRENDWLFAKTCVQIADGNYHELGTHLCRTHLVMEPIAVAAMRQLDTQHPIGIMLRVHMRFIMANNALAHGTFFSPVDGTLEQLMAGNFDEVKGFLAAVYAAWDINSAALPADFKARGVDESSTLKTYPYRQYSLWLWEAIGKFVKSYVEAFYKSADDLANDYELQAWAAECASDSDTGAKVKGFPAKITSTSQLIDLLTTIIYTCGPMHSAVNYAQKDMYYVPHFPLSAYTDVTKLVAQKEPITEKQLLQMLPPYTPANRQISVLEFLTSYQYDSFGNWDTSMREMYGLDKGFQKVFDGEAYKAVRVAMDRFQSDLKRAEAMMIQANKEENKTFPYTSLLPSKVLNSISI